MNHIFYNLFFCFYEKLIRWKFWTKHPVAKQIDEKELIISTEDYN